MHPKGYNHNPFRPPPVLKFNIPETEAVDRLVDLIREHGKWAEPEARA
ncbi:MAG TPA: hypothetical protein PLU91_17135 [Verrucomicrobiota bacterium]|nr:hypothetical protein [Verrucomicrobiota bacterium]